MTEGPGVEYRHKEDDLLILAVQLTKENAEALADWTGGLLVAEHNAEDHSIKQPGINVHTLFGKKRCSLGSWITFDGEYFEVVRNYEFERQYIKLD